MVLRTSFVQTFNSLITFNRWNNIRVTEKDKEQSDQTLSNLTKIIKEASTKAGGKENVKWVLSATNNDIGSSHLQLDYKIHKPTPVSKQVH